VTVLAVVLGAAFVAAVAAMWLAGGFCMDGWNYGGRSRLTALFACVTALALLSIAFVVLMKAEVGRMGPVENGATTSLVFVVTVLVFNAIVWHDVWRALHRLALTRLVRRSFDQSRSGGEQ